MKTPLLDKLLILVTRNSFKHGMLFLLAGMFYGPVWLNLSSGDLAQSLTFGAIAAICFGAAAFFFAKSVRTSSRILNVLGNYRMAHASLNQIPAPRDEFDTLPKLTINLSYRENQREYAKSFFTTEPERYNREEPVLINRTQPEEFLMVKLLPRPIVQKIAAQ